MNEGDDHWKRGLGGGRCPLGGRRPREARGLGREELGVPLQQDGQVMYVRGVRPYDARDPQANIN